MTVCYSLGADRWRVYILYEWSSCSEHRRIGPAHPTKEQALAWLAAARRGEVSLFDTPNVANGVDHG